MIEAILLPLDGSRFSEQAVGPAEEMARRAGARIDLLTVTDTDPSVPEIVPGPDHEKYATARYLSEVQGRLADRLKAPVTAAVFRGPISRSIEMRARATGADLVVMSSHGVGPLSRLWIGSATARFVRLAPCPVLVVRPEENGEPAEEARFSPRRVLVPLDGSDVGRTILRTATELVQLFDASVRLITIVRSTGSSVPPPQSSGPEAPPPGLLESWVQKQTDEANDFLERMAEEFRASAREVSIGVVSAQSPARGILDEIEEWDADLVAMSTHAREGVARAFLGSVADKVLRAAEVPVLLVPAGAER